MSADGSGTLSCSCLFRRPSEFHVISLNNFYTALYIFTALAKILSKPAARKVVFHWEVFEISVQSGGAGKSR